MRKKGNRETIKRVLAMVCAVALAFAIAVSVIVPALAATQQQKNSAKQKTQEAKKDLQNAQNAHKTILDEFNALDKEISNTETEITQLEKQITQTEEDLVLKEAELAQAEADYARYKDMFLTRARVMYENSDMKYLEILFGAKSFSDFLSKLSMVSQLMEYDRSVLNNLNDSKDRIASAKKDLEDILKRQEENLVNLTERKSSLDVALAAKQKLLDEAAADVNKYKLIYESAEAAEQALYNENKAAFQAAAYPVTYTGGKFMWPVPGSHRVTSQYGNRIHPVYKTKKFHTGIDIGAGYGLDIVASADGVVTLATTNGGYGKCIVINHGSGLTTLYGHCSTLLVSYGDKVKKGQVIGKVGSTGVSTGPHLHYEVRVNGSYKNPLSYVQ